MESEFIFPEAPFASCHASTLVETAQGDLLAAWFGGSREGNEDVAIYVSRRSGGTWSPPQATAEEPRMPCWNPVLFRDAQDKVWLFYKVGPSPQTWTGAYSTSVDGGASWTAPTYFPAGLLGPIKNKPILLSNGDVLCGTSTESYHAWSCWVELSSDGGVTWTKHGPIVVPGENYGVIQPAVFETSPGHVRMLMRSTQRIGRVCLATSEDSGRTWSPARPTSLPNPNSGIDAVRLREGVVALVYNHTAAARTPLNLAVSRDEGETWCPPIALETEEGEYSYPAIIQAADGKLHITYTWRRQRIKHVVLEVEEAVGRGQRRSGLKGAPAITVIRGDSGPAGSA